MATEIEINKNYRTKRGELVRRVLRVGSLTSTMYPVWVEMENGDVRNYTSDGAYYHSTAFPSGRDLVEVCEWDDFKIDDKVMAGNIGIGEEWHKQHFAGVNYEGKPMTFAGGSTSWTRPNELTAWDECRRPTEKELK